jgi:hypothetical protein
LSKRSDLNDSEDMVINVQDKTTSNSRMSINASSLGMLRKLPAEIRIIIYEMVLLSEDKEPRAARGDWMYWKASNSRRSHLPDMLAVSKSMRRETVPLYYRRYALVFIRNHSELRDVLERLRTLAENLYITNQTVVFKSTTITIARLGPHDCCNHDSMLGGAEITQLLCTLGGTIVTYWSVPCLGCPWLPDCMIVARILGYLAFKKAWSADQLAHNARFARHDMIRGDIYSHFDDLWEAARIPLRLPEQSDIGIVYLMPHSAGAPCRDRSRGVFVEYDGNIFQMSKTACSGALDRTN